MKKSFKKAGAAVLSMAMLLSMGAVSLPVYAVDYHNTYKPAQVEITIAASNGTGSTALQNDAKHSYDYLKDIDHATVKMYRVAELDGSGWHWDTALMNSLTSGTYLSDTTDTLNNGGVVTDFEQLLARSVLDNGTWVDDPTHSATGSVPTLTSDQLQALAAKLERVITEKNAAATAGNEPFTPIATDNITKTGSNFSTAVLPSNGNIYSDDTSETTKNVRGYYLILTETPDSGIIVQPVLIGLENEKLTTAEEAEGLTPPRKVKKLSLKGTNVSIDKSIIEVRTNLDSDGKLATKDEDIVVSKSLKEGEAISNSQNTASVNKDDTITYQIKADVPKYDPNLAPEEITSFVITDTPDKGINVIGRSEGSYLDVRATTTGTNNKIKVYWSADDSLNISETTGNTGDILLTEGQDYTIAPNNADGKGKGFSVTFTGNQLRGKTSDEDEGITTYSNNAESALRKNRTGENVVETMEKGYVFIQFDALTTDNFKRNYNDVSELSAADLATYEATLAAMQTPKNQADAYADNDITENTEAAYNAYVATIEAANAERQATIDALFDNGNKNVAEMTYAYNFSTGKTTRTSDDTTKLFSVDVNLTKVVANNNIKTERDGETVYYLGGITSDKNENNPTAWENSENTGVTYYVSADDSNMITTDITAASGYDALDSTNANVLVVTGITEKTSSDGTAPAGALKDGDDNYYFIMADGTIAKGTGNTAPANNKTSGGTVASYEDADSTVEPVQNAVFKLSHDYNTYTYTETGATTADADYELGYAISDANGKLHEVTKVTQLATATEPASYAVKSAERDGVTANGEDSSKKYVDYYVPVANGELCWQRLSVGTYKLEEVYAPTGFKKWAAPVTFTITGEGTGTDGSTQTTGADYTGKFNGVSTDDAFLNTFTFENTSKAVDTTSKNAANQSATAGTVKIGQLKNDIQNYYDDKLPATGGIGTVLFTAGGISIVLIAGALFVMYMKKRDTEEE